MSAHRTRLGAVMVAVVVATAAFSPSAVSAAPTISVPRATPSLPSVVATTMTISATVEIHSSLVPVDSRTATVAYTCVGVMVGDGRVATAARCVDPTLDFVAQGLRDRSVDNLAHDWSLSRATTARLKKLARAGEWKVTTHGLASRPTADYTIHSPTGSGTIIETSATRVPVDDARVGLLDARRQIPEVSVARFSPIAPEAGARASISTLDPDPDVPTEISPKRTFSTIAGVERTRFELTAETPSSALGAPAFDARGRLLGITTNWGSSTIVANAPVVKSILAKAPAPRPTPSESAPTSPTSSSTPQRRPTSAVDSPSTAARADDEPSEPMSSWAKVALSVGFFDVLVLGAVVVAYRRRRG